MFEKVIALFDSGKLMNYIWFFGCMTLGISAITGMASAYCGLESRKQRRSAAEKCADQ